MLKSSHSVGAALGFSSFSCWLFSTATSWLFSTAAAFSSPVIFFHHFVFAKWNVRLGRATIEFWGFLQMSLDLPADMCIKGGCLPWCLWLPLGPPSCCMWECAGFPSWLPRPSKLAPLPPSPIPPPNHLGLNKQSQVCGNLNRI